jgi:hypothetical protein
MRRFHRILIGAKREDFGKEVWWCDTTDREALRASLLSFAQFSSKKDRMIVDTAGWLGEADEWGLFLKILEDESVQGEICFYGGLLVNYPETVRSRCAVEGKHFDVESESFLDFVKCVNAEHMTPMFKHLQTYNVLQAWEILKSKERFLAFMYHLGSASPNNFHMMFAPLTSMKEPCYKYLFYEWLQKNPIFSDSELEICEFFRDGKFEKLLHRFLNTAFAVDEYLFPFLITYKMWRKTK